MGGVGGVNGVDVDVNDTGTSTGAGAGAGSPADEEAGRRRGRPAGLRRRLMGDLCRTPKQGLSGRMSFVWSHARLSCRRRRRCH